ncbi:MAG: cysteine desulfurase family protein [Mariniblastus sp.]
MTELIYLDHNSTSPIDPSVAAAIQKCHEEGFVNPASQHRPGQMARRKLEELRRRMAEILGANCVGMQTDQLILTSGGTESNNLALLGLAGVAKEKWENQNSETQQNETDTDDQTNFNSNPPVKILISSIEHPSVIGAAEQLARLGYDVEKIPVDQNGVCRLDTFSSLLKSDDAGAIGLVSVMLANNETGAIQPIREMVEMCKTIAREQNRQNEILFHTDAVQAVGKLNVDFAELGVDALSFTAHKLCGPRGIGGLLIRHGLSPHPILMGGFQQMAIRPGTEDVALAAGMCQALEIFVSESKSRFERLETLRDQLQSDLKSEFDDLVINSDNADRVPHTLNVSFPGIDRQSFLMAADMAGLAISTGSACASGSSELSPVLMAMDLPKEVIEGSIRISLGVSTTADEIAETSRRISKIIGVFRARK